MILTRKWLTDFLLPKHDHITAEMFESKSHVIVVTPHWDIFAAHRLMCLKLPNTHTKISKHGSVDGCLEHGTYNPADPTSSSALTASEVISRYSWVRIPHHARKLLTTALLFAEILFMFCLKIIFVSVQLYLPLRYRYYRMYMKVVLLNDRHGTSMLLTLAVYRIQTSVYLT